jgi:outer membrane protein insertion porin family
LPHDFHILERFAGHGRMVETGVADQLTKLTTMAFGTNKIKAVLVTSNMQHAVVNRTASFQYLRLCMALSSALAAPAVSAQTAAAPSASAPAANVQAPIPPGTVKVVNVTGNERLEAETVRTYVQLNVGDAYDATSIDLALKRLYATELFADATIRVDNGILTINVRENPVINRIVFEGSKRVKEEKLREEVRLAPRQIFTRSKARADVSRMIEVYRRSGRFAATIEPKIIQLPQNRVDLVFEIDEGPKSRIRQINFIGNKEFSDGDLRGGLYSRQARWYRLFTSNDTYDPDRLAADREKLRQHYFTEGYADFRVISAVSELTSDRKDFIVTFTIEEGDRYKFGKVDLESKIRDIKSADYKKIIPIKEGEWFNAKRIEDTEELLKNTAGLFGYAFADVRSKPTRNKDKKIIDFNFEIAEAPRVYVERIDINGNTRTLDKVIRREFRLAEGDAFNSFKVKRSKERIQSLGFFQEKLEIEQKPGSSPDKVVLEVNVEEKSTGQLTLGAGFSSFERFVFNLGLAQKNFMGKGQDLRANFEISSFRNQIDLSFTEPYFLGRNLSVGADVFRRDANCLNAARSTCGNTQYSQTDLGFGLRAGFNVTEYWTYVARYNLVRSKLDYQNVSRAFRDAFGNPVLTNLLDSNDRPVPNGAGGFVRTIDTRPTANLGLGQVCVLGSQSVSAVICDEIGARTTSSIGHSLIYNSLDNGQRPNRGQRFIFSQDFAGLGGSVRYLRNTVQYDYFVPIIGRWVLRLGAEGGHIATWGKTTERDISGGADVPTDRRIRLNDRFFLGTPQFRGYAFRGVGPREAFPTIDELGNIVRDAAGNAVFSKDTKGNILGESLGGQIYYKGTAELRVPLGQAASELGLQAAAFFDIGSLWKVNVNPRVIPVNQIKDRIIGNTSAPRMAVGIGVSWNSPFGPFRIDISKPLNKQPGDITETFQFNVGTSF